jgi:phage shock protein E
MKKLLKNNWWIAGAVLGGASGYLYWKYIGCISGTCAITSKPFNSIVYFSMMGGLLFSMFQPKKKLPAKNFPADKNTL